MPSSALIIEVPDAEPVVGRWRERYDPIAQYGIPAHVTVLYPFHPPSDITPAMLDVIAEVAASTEAFEFELSSLGEFPGVLWLRPWPAGAFMALTHRLAQEFPECPPYEGKFRGSRPHITIVHPAALGDSSLDEVRAEIETELGALLPIRTTATALSVYGSDDDTNWRLVGRYPLAPRRTS